MMQTNVSKKCNKRKTAASIYVRILFDTFDDYTFDD